MGPKRNLKCILNGPMIALNIKASVNFLYTVLAIVADMEKSQTCKQCLQTIFEKIGDIFGQRRPFL